MRSDEIEGLIRQGLPGTRVRVLDETGGGDHFQAVVVSPEFAGKGLVERHQLVYAILQGAMAGRIHALSLKTYTPDEWTALQ
ncbi:MAG: BolA family transcriptional regulator [Candidatus Binatia bacterium]